MLTCFVLPCDSLTEELEKFTSRTNSPTSSITDVSYAREPSKDKGPHHPLGEIVDSLRRLQLDVEAVHDADLAGLLRDKQTIRTRVSKAMKLSRMPPILCIHLCRYLSANRFRTYAPGERWFPVLAHCGCAGAGELFLL